MQLKTDKEQWRTRKLAYFFSDWPKWLKYPLTASFWPEERPITMEELKYGWTDPDGTLHQGLNQAVTLPGVANAWPYPIENRINMLSTGIKTPVGIKILGPDLDTLNSLASQVAAAVSPIDGTTSAYAERAMGGYYLDIAPIDSEIARYALTRGDVQDVIQTAIGGMNVTTTVEGPARYPLNIRFANELRDNIPALQQVLVNTPRGPQIPLGQLANFKIDRLNGVSEKDAVAMVSREAHQRINSLNIPSVLAFQNDDIYVNSDNLDLYWSILPNGKTPDVRKAVSMLQRLLGFRLNAGDITVITAPHIADQSLPPAFRTARP